MTAPADTEFSRPVAADAMVPGARFEGTASAEERAALAGRFGVEAVRSLGFRAEALTWGPSGVRLRGVAEAALTQVCVVTLEPIETRIAEPFERFFAPPEQIAQAGALLDSDLDEAPEPLGAAVDVGEVAAETVALAIDPYPRAPGAAFDGVLSAPPGVEPLTDEQARPFAGLAALKARGEGG